MTAPNANRDSHFVVEPSLVRETLKCISFPAAVRFPGTNSIRLFGSKGEAFFVVSVFLLIISLKNK